MESEVFISYGMGGITHRTGGRPFPPACSCCGRWEEGCAFLKPGPSS